MVEALKNRKLWITLAAAAGLLAVVYFAYLGALVSPQENTEDLPIAVVNADRGSQADGQTMNLGDQVQKKVTSPDSPLAKTVDWTRLDSREKALEGLREGDYYGAIVIPKNYSEQLTKLSSPQAESQANPQGKPQGSGGGSSDGQAASETSASGAPKPVKIEVFTNPAAGQSASSTAENISLGVVDQVSKTTSQRAVSAVEENGGSVPAALAPVLGNPVRADVSPAVELGPDSGGGNTAFFLVFLGVIAGLAGAALVYFGMSGSLTSSPKPASAVNLFPVKLVFGLAFAGLVAALESVVAMGLFGVDHSVSAFYVFLWLWLAISSMLTITLLLLEAFGHVGIGLSALLNFLLGLVCSGGLFPLESLPAIYRAYATVLPLRHDVDGMRALLFYDGNFDARLGTALVVLIAYLLGSAVLGFVVAAVKARASRPEPVPAARVANPQEELLLLGTVFEYISRRVESGDDTSPGLVSAVSGLIGPGEEASSYASERERAVEASRTILRPLSRLFLGGYLRGGGVVPGEEGGRS